MQTVTMVQAQSQLADLIEAAAKGEPFLIADEGKRLLKITVVEEPAVGRTVRRIGFMEGEIKVPDDFDTMGREEINRMFGIED